MSLFEKEKINAADFEKRENKEGNVEKSMQCKTEILDLAQTVDVEEIRDAIVKLVEANWGKGDPYFSPEAVEKFLRNPSNITVLLRTFKDKIIGYSMATPDEDDDKGESAYIYSTDIHPSFQGKKLVAGIMKIMEGEIKRRGYKFITRDAAVDNGYADSIERHYKERIILKNDHSSDYGRQRYFKIKVDK